LRSCVAAPRVVDMVDVACQFEFEREVECSEDFEAVLDL
jgi:hypothetical protein